MGKFAIDIGCAFRVGTLRGETSQLSALGITSSEFFSSVGDAFDSLVQRKIRELHESVSEFHAADFRRWRTSDEPKARWVDGTPEYSFHVFGLRQLFPQARFIHILRAVDSVARSLLSFRSVAGFDIVEGERDAYDYWLRTVTAAVQAERALGAENVMRIRYDDLVAAPERTLRNCFKFLGEPFCPACLEPMSRIINSSKVASSTLPEENPGNSELIDRARRLSAELLKSEGARECADESAWKVLNAEFTEQVAFYAGLEAERDSAVEYLAGMEAERDSAMLHLTAIREEKEKIVVALRSADDELARFRIEHAQSPVPMATTSKNANS